MIGMRYMALAFTALALGAAAVSAKAGEAHQFEIAGQTFTVPVPEGYCLPSGPDIALAQKVAALDTVNLTLAMFERCGTFGDDYVHIKSPRQAGPMRTLRKLFVEMVARELQGTMGQQVLAEAMDKAGQQIAEGTDNALALDDLRPRFAGQDDVCAYLVLTANVVNQTGTQSIRAGSCFTVAGGRFINVNAYALVGSGVTDEQLKARAQAIALSITASE
jgi:hypothetical protein